MKFSAAFLSLFALSAMAAPSSLQDRNAAPIDSGAVSLIEGLEGFRANFYEINGHQTIGYGHDCTEKEDCDSIHPPLSQAQGTALLQKDLAGFEQCVCALSNAKSLNANQYGALVSFAYNSGCGGVSEYWHGAMTEKNFNGICEALPNTNTLGGELTTRREAEGKFCSEPTNQTSGCT
ncbi:glycoside hydrolase family 24 protein [Elaphomyces granulatus]